MTVKPKKKAKELILKFMLVKNVLYRTARVKVLINIGQQSAIIFVDETIDELKEILKITGSSFVIEKINYWEQVKQKINDYQSGKYK
jgi:hypothetical protein